MKKTTVLSYLYLILASCVIILSVNTALAEDGIDQAKKLITIERYDAAHKLIEAVIVKDPTNAKNFYRAGILYINIGWDTQANRSFDFATILDKGNKYKFKVATFYQGQAYLAANNGEIKSAKFYLAKAHSLNPSLKQKDLKDFMSFGEKYLQRHQEKKAYLNFKIAQSIDMQQGDTISDFYFEAGKNCKKLCLPYYRRAKEFSSKHDVKIVYLLYSLHKTEGISDQDKKTLKNEIKLYVSKEEFGRMFPPPPPNRVYSKSGLFDIPVNKNETTPYWIIIETGNKGGYNFKSDKWKFIVTYHDGEVAKAWEIKKWPTKKLIKFKVTNLSDEQLKLAIR